MRKSQRRRLNSKLASFRRVEYDSVGCAAISVPPAHGLKRHVNRTRRDLMEQKSAMSARMKILFAAACMIACAGCQTPHTDESTPVVRHMEVNGMPLPYVEQGRGALLVLVHGAASDLRTWERQRAALAAHYRTIAFTQRYYGTAPWPADWPQYRIGTHADDLAAFIRGLGAGPAHLVAWSSGSHIVLNVALRNPELVRSVFVYEPVVPSYVDDPAELKAIGDDAGAMVGSAFSPMKAGDTKQAARLFIDGVAERGGYFDALPPAQQAIVLDNARVLPLMFDGGEQDAPISCSQLAQLKPRVAIARGEKVRPFFRIIADAAARCMPAARRIVVPGAKHMWPGEDPIAFSQTVHGFVDGR